MGFNKKVLSKAVSELDKAKAPGKPKDIIVDPAGQWKYPGQKTRIPSSDITMQGVNYPVFAQPNVGPGAIMQPGQDYQFPSADYVDETPLAKKGGTLQSKKYSKSMSATNKLMAKNKLFESKKSKIFDPNAKFKSGGSKLGPINLNPNPLSHYELNYGFNLPVKQDGGESDYEELELTPKEIQAYRDGGYVVEELPEAQTGGTRKPLEISDPNKFAFRDRAYKDSLDMYKNDLLATKYHNLTNNAQSMSDMAKYMKLEALATKNMENIKKNSPAKFGSIYAKQKKPVQPVVFKNGITNINNTKSKITPVKTKQPITKNKFTGTPEYKKGELILNDENNLTTNTDVVPEGYSRVGDRTITSRDPKTGKIIESKEFMYEPIPQLPLRPLQNFTMAEPTLQVTKPQLPKKQYNTKTGKWTEGVHRPDTQEFINKNIEYKNSLLNNNSITQVYQTGGSKFKRTAFDEDTKSNVGWSSAPVAKKKPLTTTQKKAQKTFDKNFKVTDKSKYEKTEDKIAEAQKAYVDWTKKTGRTFTDADLKNIADQQWSFAGVGPQQSEDMMRATPEQSSGSRAWEYITNPFTAAEYAISGGGAENMPHNINEMRMAGIDPGVVQGRNLVGNMLNSSLNLFDAGDKVARNVSRGNYGSALLEGLRFAPGSGLLDDAVRLGVKPGAKYLGKALNKVKTKQLPGSSNNNVRLEFNPQRSNELNSISHDIHYGNQKVGEVSGNYKSSGDFEISDVGVDKAFQKKGISKQAYNLLNEAHPNNKVVSFGAYNTDAAGMQPGKNLWESLVREGKAKKVGNSYEMLNSKNVSSELPGSFSPSSGTSGTLNSGISPELIKNAVGPRNKVAASILNRAYFDPFFNKTLNKISPLNFIPGYGSKLTGAVKPLGNVINRSIKDGNLVESKNLLQQAKGLLKKTDDADLTTKMNKSNTDIYSAKIDDSVQGSNVGLGTANKQGVLGRTFNKSNAVYPLQTKTGNTLNKVPLSDPGVSLHRRLPFSNRYVPIDKQKLLNNKFQWSTTGAGLQNVGEKFVKALPTYGLIGGAGAAALYNPYDYMPAESAEFIKENNIPLEDITDLPTRTDAFKEGFKSSLISPTQFLAEPDPHGVRFYGSLLGYSQGGNVINEEWEDELDDYTIELLRKAGYVVKEID
jgi:hypothetical protein